MAATDAACPSCGEPRRAARPAASTSTQDVFQYVKIVGIIVVVVVVVLVVAGMMGGDPGKCTECRGKKVVACVNCKDGRNLCKNCKGQGHDLQTFSTCPDCQGKGQTATCWKCGGRPPKTCPTCKGTGTQPE
jgi:hypothetical protein